MAATMYPSSSTLSFLGVVFQTGARVLGPLGLIIVKSRLGVALQLTPEFWLLCRPGAHSFICFWPAPEARPLRRFSFAVASTITA